MDDKLKRLNEILESSFDAYHTPSRSEAEETLEIIREARPDLYSELRSANYTLENLSETHTSEDNSKETSTALVKADSLDDKVGVNPVQVVGIMAKDCVVDIYNGAVTVGKYSLKGIKYSLKGADVFFVQFSSQRCSGKNSW